MDQPPLVMPVSVLALFGLAIWAAVAFWTVAIARWRAGLPMLPVAPRRQVPWRGIDMAMIVVFYVASISGALTLAHVVLGHDACQPLPVTHADGPNEHLVVQLLLRGGFGTMIACVAAAAVIAPLAEEILFRLFLQGWFESLDRRLSPWMPTLRRWFRWGTLPVVISSLLFAMMHFRVDGKQYDVDYLRFMMIGLAVSSLATAAFAVALARLARGATAADLGLVREKILGDVGLGLVAFGGIAAPVFAVQLTLAELLPSYIAADPFTLFPFALVLGTLYCRTHRIVPSITLHAMLNTTSLVLLWLQTLGQGAA